MGNDEIAGSRHACSLRLSDFDYDFPKELIAYKPLKRRDQSRLLVIDRKTANIEHRKFSDIQKYLNKGDTVVLNDTKVLPAELSAKFANGSKAELLVLEKIGKNRAKCLVKPARKFNQGAEIIFSNGSTAGVLESYFEKILRFSYPVDGLLKKIGKMPLPPYIKRESGKADFKTYQTVYAKNTGAVAAPTAGLHFTKDVLKDIAKKGVNTAHVTLHVGYGTFKPVRDEDITEHKMHSEQFSAPKNTIDLINVTRKNKGRILAVGTTSCRVLETIAGDDWCTSAPVHQKGHTNLFIYPPYKFKLTDMLLTNFHLPKTTLLMLVAAFCGYDLMMKAYKQAIEKKYRLFSYGDAMLIL